jgi:fructose-1,6-bisphosphatase/inositol monophosphatase family enzyme
MLRAELTHVLWSGKEYMWGLRTGRDVVREGAAFGDLNDDTELRGDLALGAYLARMLVHRLPRVRRVTVEGLGEFPGNPAGDLWATVDPIDGSLNYLHAGGMTGLPFVTCVTLLRDSSRVTFADVVAAGVIDLRHGLDDLWYSEVDVADQYTTLAGRLEVNNGWMRHQWRRLTGGGLDDVGRRLKPARVLQVSNLDLAKMVVIGEFYYPENRKLMVAAFAGEKGWLRNPGSAAYEMACVASGQTAAFICDRQKQHELGAAYALVLGAGGVAVDLDGRDLGSRVYDFKTQTPVILAANQRIADQIIERLYRVV